MSAKLVVTSERDGTHITLHGASGKPLMTSPAFTEPRAKGATLRALKGILGENVTVEDPTVTRRPTTAMSMPATARAGQRAGRGARSRSG